MILFFAQLLIIVGKLKAMTAIPIVTKITPTTLPDSVVKSQVPMISDKLMCPSVNRLTMPMMIGEITVSSESRPMTKLPLKPMIKPQT